MINTPCAYAPDKSKNKGSGTMNSYLKPNLEATILSTNADPLKPINVGILDKEGFIQEIITLEELSRIGNSQSVNMHNYGTFGEVEYEFTISDADNLCAKVAYLREQQKHLTETS
jgi:hypothetical protein